MAGHCEWRLGKRRRVMLHTGEAMLLKPGLQHCEQVNAPGRVRLAWLGFDLEGGEPDWCQQAISLDADVAEITGYFDAISREHHLADGRSRMRINLALQSLLLLLERRAETARDEEASAVPPQSNLNPRQVHTVESAAYYFQNNLQRPLSIAQVAGYHSLCPAHFSALFRRHHRMTPRTFLRLARLQRAVDLLAESDLTIKEIAAQCGFVDSAHLCKSFKQEHSVPPNVFRRNHYKRPHIHARIDAHH